VLTLVVVGVFATGGAAQDRPDFSGTWTSATVSPTRGGPALPGARLGSGWGLEFTIVQGTDSLLVERVFFVRGDLQPVMKFRYSLDGSETRNSVRMGRGLQRQTSRSEWDGDELVITTVHGFLDPGDGQARGQEVTQTLSLQAARTPAWGPSLVVETTVSGALGGLPSSTRTVYTKR